MAAAPQRLKVACLTSVGLLLVLALGEAALRLFGAESADPSALVVWNPDRDEELRAGTGMHANDSRQLWRPRAGAPIPWGSGNEVVNPAGYRGPLRPRAKEPGVIRIATLGDSSTFGHSVGYSHGYSAVLEELLRAAGCNAEVLCFGVVGSTAVQGVRRYVDVARHWEPDVVVLAFGAVNEHFAAPGFRSDEQRIERLSAPLSALDFLVQRSRLLGALSRWSGPPDSGVDERLSTGGSGRSDWDGVRRVSVAEYQEAIRGLVRAAQVDGARVCLVAMPRTAAAEAARPVLARYTQATHALSAELGAPIADVRRVFAERIVGGVDEGQLFFDGFHPTVRGHRLLAEELAPLVLELAGR